MHVSSRADSPAGDMTSMLHDLLGQGYLFMHASFTGIANRALNMSCIILFKCMYLVC